MEDRRNSCPIAELKSKIDSLTRLTNDVLHKSSCSSRSRTRSSRMLVKTRPPRRRNTFATLPLEQVVPGVGHCTCRGRKPHMRHWKNQDSLIYRCKGFAGLSGTCIFGVFDGHGSKGHEISQYVSKQMAVELETLIGRMMAAAALQRAFVQIRDSLDDNDELDAENSGCTAVVTVIGPTMITTSNLGDSKGVLLKRVAGGTEFDASVTFQCVELTVDHKPDRPDEKRRIEMVGGQIWTFGEAGRSSRVGDDEQSLAMSRSFGDTALRKCGVISEPDISECERNAADDWVLIVATDGVWDMVGTRELPELFAAWIGCECVVAGEEEKYVDWSGWSSSRCANKLVALASKRWSDCRESDDITAVVADIRKACTIPPGSPGLFELAPHVAEEGEEDGIAAPTLSRVTASPRVRRRPIVAADEMRTLSPIAKESKGLGRMRYGTL